MPDKPLTIAYAAGASLTAITLIYVFGPTFFLDGTTGTSSRNAGVVGLTNPANDCFINSVLQALAGLGDLRLYLIRELHRRTLEGPEVHQGDLGDVNEAQAWKREGLRQGLVTKALKKILDSLNERPIYKKTISAGPFISALEHAFRTRISRNQQDAQEFLQIVAERLCDEFHAGQRARQKLLPLQGEAIAREDARVQILQSGEGEANILSSELHQTSTGHRGQDVGEPASADRQEINAAEGFPMEGRLESQIECLTCHFRPKPSVSSFVTLTLHVPQVPSTSLSSCFDGIFKVEHIDDYKCDRCRLEHALKVKSEQLASAPLAEESSRLEKEIFSIRTALETDPEKPPDGIRLPDLSLAPKRRIAKHMRISLFPKTMAIHLSRSIFALGHVSTKNMAKVTFPETLPLGGILHQRKYKLLCVVTHKGAHNSGHYETFRRQVVPAPFSTPNTFSDSGLLSTTPSTEPSPVLEGKQEKSLESPTPEELDGTPLTPDRSASDPPSSSISPPKKGPRQRFLQRPDSQVTATAPFSLSEPREQPSVSTTRFDPSRSRRRMKKVNDRWWRISDEKIKEGKTSDVLSMQKEVYLLFYELEREPGLKG